MCLQRTVAMVVLLVALSSAVIGPPALCAQTEGLDDPAPAASYAETSQVVYSPPSANECAADAHTAGPALGEGWLISWLRRVAEARATRIVQRAVYQEGALGIISYWNIPEWDRLNRLPGDSPTLVGWPEFPDLSARPHGTFAFMITPQRAHELEEMMGAGAQIRLRALVDARTVPGTFSVVSATIPGSRNPHQEIILTAHLDEIGANDNASGSAVLLEVARTLKDLIDRKQIPPPVRTVRFLWGPEFLGPRAWLSKYLQGQVKRIANLNYDMSGEDLSKTGSVFSIVRTPDSTPSFLNALMECILDFMNRYNDYTYAVQKDFQIISVTGSREALRGRMEPFEEGSDHELFDHLGIPAVRIHAAWPDWFYHSSKDSPDKSDPTTLHRSIFAGLAAIVSMSYAEDPQAVDLGQIAWEYGKRGVARDVTRAIALVSSAASANLPARARWARAIARHAYDREQAAILSCGVFTENPATERILAEKAADLGRDQQTSMQSIDNALSARATELGVALPSVAPTAAELEAARLVPMRRPGEELKGLGYVGSRVESKAEAGRVEKALTAVEATMKREGAFDLQVYAVPDAPAFYVDGHRSILDIWEHFAAEYRPLPLDILRTYFDLFEKMGVMTIHRK